MAVVHIDVETDNRTIFKVYYQGKGAGWTEWKSSPVVISPGRTEYSFRLTDLRKVSLLRLDTSEKPATVTVRSVVISQPGFAPLSISSREEFEKLEAANGIAELTVTDAGITVKPAGLDPYLVYTVPPLVKMERMPAEVFRIIGLVLLACLCVLVGRAAFADYRFVSSFLLVALTLIAVMAGLSLYNQHPDEGVHVEAAEYYQDHTLPPRVGDSEILHTYSKYGVSRLHSGEIAYFFAGKFASFIAPLQLPSYLAMRCFNVALFALLVLLATRHVNFRILLIPLILSPQIWYIFSYFNSEAFAICITMLVAYQMVVEKSAWNRLLDDPFAPGTLRAIPLLGLLLGLFLLVKVNFYFFGIFLFFYFLWRLVFYKTILDRANIIRGVAVILMAVSVFAAVRLTDSWINDFNKKELILGAREAYAEKMFKPSTPLDKKYAYLQMKERGVRAGEIINQDRWGEKMFRSSFGEYGYMTVAASFGLYDCIRYVGLALLAVALIAVCISGGRQGATLMGITLVSALALMAMAFYHAWSVDFQAQGRYFLPIVGMLAIFSFEMRRSLANLPLAILVCVLYGLSLYSFIFVALAGIAQTTFALG